MKYYSRYFMLKDYDRKWIPSKWEAATKDRDRIVKGVDIVVEKFGIITKRYRADDITRRCGQGYTVTGWYVSFSYYDPDDKFEKLLEDDEFIIIHG